MRGRTYRYFDGEVLFPFGYGLSYTTFECSNLRLDRSRIKENESVKLFVDVKNIGRRSGAEVVQLYIKGKGVSENDAIKTLKGFEKVFIKSNENKTVSFEINSETLHKFIEGKGFTVERGEYVLLVGSSSSKTDLKEIKLIIE